MQMRTLLILLILPFIFSCSEKKEQIEKSNSKIKAVVSILPYKNIVEIIGGDKIEVKTLIPPGTSAHSLELSPLQLKSIENADLYFKVGGPFQFEKVLMNKFSIDTASVSIVDCSVGIEITDNNPHIWLSPLNVEKIVSTIAGKLILKYPEYSDEFKDNLQNFIEELNSIDSKLRLEFSKLKSNQFMVYHGAWGYFARDYNLVQIPFEIEGKSLKAGDYRSAIALAKKINAKVLFADPHHDSSPVKAVADELNIKMDYLDPLPENYIQNLETILTKFKMHLN